MGRNGTRHKGLGNRGRTTMQGTEIRYQIAIDFFRRVSGVSFYEYDFV